MRRNILTPAVLASALLVAPMLAHGQTQTTPPGGGPTTTPTAPQAATPGQPAPPTAGTSPGMTPGGAIGQTPGGTTPGTSPGTTAPTAGMTAPGTTAGAGAAFPAGSAVMARPRMSQIIGANVYNDENNSIGSVDDIILVPPAGAAAAGAAAGAGRGPLAVIQVGGFLGLGGRLVAVPLTDLQWNAERERVMLPGATRDGLRERPEFNYDSVRTGSR
ncbi:PRC-barrel domain-containing protein [Roseococcus microcysteis]|uniref:PRC-barrel domain-containing protein n=1 Tax=Roseococcus microcysteis TaxID=2771361 RepID=UPI00168A8362|nr:PRC-barrel domain-containing protein [Roseococcus microcysteis]